MHLWDKRHGLSRVENKLGSSNRGRSLNNRVLLVLASGQALSNGEDPVLPVDTDSDLLAGNLSGRSPLAGLQEKVVVTIGEGLDAVETGQNVQGNPTVGVHLLTQEHVLAQVLNREVVLNLVSNKTNKLVLVLHGHVSKLVMRIVGSVVFVGVVARGSAVVVRVELLVEIATTVVVVVVVVVVMVGVVVLLLGVSSRSSSSSSGSSRRRNRLLGSFLARARRHRRGTGSLGLVSSRLVRLFSLLGTVLGSKVL